MTAPHPRSFRFGVQASSAGDAASWRETARKAEDLGYAVLSVADHLDDQFATIPALMAAADATSTIRLGAMVLCNDYHHPVMTAKETATVDLLSDGRLEVGLGAGWQTTDYEQSGIPLDPPGVRIDRLAEAVAVIKQLWTEGPVEHTGSNYRIRGLEGAPKPCQRPHPPIVIGGGGRRILSLAAREADTVALNIRLDAGVIGPTSGPTATAAATDRKLAWVREAAGDRFAQLEIQTRIHLAMVTDDKPGVAEWASPAFGMTVEEGYESPHALVGTLEEIEADCLARRERWGISYITVAVEAMEELAPVVAHLAGT